MNMTVKTYYVTQMALLIKNNLFRNKYKIIQGTDIMTSAASTAVIINIV